MQAASGTRSVGWFSILGLVIGLAGPGVGGRPARAADGGISPEDLPLVDRFSADTTSYLYRMGWEELEGRLAGTTVLEVIQSRGVQGFFEEMRRLGKRGDQDGKMYDFVLSALHEDIVIAGAPGKPKSGGGTVYGAIVRPGPKGAKRFAEQYVAATDGGGPGRQPVRIAPIQYTLLEGADTSREGEARVHTALHDGRLYWARGRQAAEMIAKPTEGVPLGRGTIFRQTVGPLLAGQTSKPVAVYFHESRARWKRLVRGKAAPFWNTLSWRSIDALAGATFVEGDGYRNRHYWKIGPVRTGLFKHTRTARVEQAWLERVPAESSGFVTGVWDGVSFLNTFTAIGLAIEAIRPHKGPVRGVAEEMPRVRELLEQIGPRYLVYRVPGKYGSMFPLPIADVVLASELRDAAAFSAALQALLDDKTSGVAVSTSELLGRKTWSITSGYTPLSVHLHVGDKVVFAALNPQLLQDAVENWDDPVESLVDTPAYKEASKYKLPEACFELYFPPDGFTRGFYDQYVPMLQQMLGMFRQMPRGPGGEQPPESTLGFNPAALPRGSVFTRRVKQGTILTARDDGEGILFDGHAPVLCTPYYVLYLHALTKLHPDGVGAITEVPRYLILPPPS